MRIIRIDGPDGPVYGSVRAEGVFLCEGDLFAGLRETARPAPDGPRLAPLVPATIYAIGLNYRSHAEEMAKPIPEHPVVTMKSPTAVIGPGAPIRLPQRLRSDSVDYECELAVVIGRTCRNVERAEAGDCIFGYTAANDVSARDWQKLYSGGQWCRGKTFDTFCPLGPCLVTGDELADAGALNLRTVLGGEVVQESNTRDMIFGVGELIEFLSADTTLAPGTVILTGTPPGVGAARTPPRYLRAGDTVAVEIEGIGRLANPVAGAAV